jgi:tetratricopeptide (TPR) repeat protein
MTLAVLVTLLCVPTPPVKAHAPASQRIAAITELLQEHPSAALHLERAGLFRKSGHWAAAVRDCDTAMRLDPELAEVDLCRSRIALDRADVAGAVEHARAFLARKKTPAGYRTLSRALAGGGRTLEAASALQSAIDLAEVPEPDDFLGLARLRANDPLAAVAALDAGLDALGPLVVLQEEAVRLLAAASRYDEALRRLDLILAEIARPERWLAERARILAAAGRGPESWVAASDALAAIERLPASHRTTPIVRELEIELRARLAVTTEGTR